MLSERTGFDLTENRWSRAVAARRRAGAELVDLTLSNPTRAGLPYPPDLLAPLAEPAGLHYAPDPRGLRAAREAVAADYARRGHAVAPERILLTASTSEAYAFLFKVLCDPGDEVLVPRPSYPLFEYLAALEAVRPVPYALAYDGEWHVDLVTVRAALGPRSRALVAVNPNNPTGSFLKRDEHERLLALCAQTGIALVSDEVFADYGFGDDPRRVTAVVEDGPVLSFSLGGFSKSCGLPQAKLAWIAVAGPASPRAAALQRLELVSDTFLSVSTPVQAAARALLRGSAPVREAIRLRTARNLHAARRRLDGTAASVLACEGGWSAVVRVPGTLSEEERVLSLLEAGVVVHPGYFFDFEREAYLVLSLLPAEPDFAAGLEAIAASVED